jgi:hypothetical protein
MEMVSTTLQFAVFTITKAQLIIKGRGARASSMAQPYTYILSQGCIEFYWRRRRGRNKRYNTYTVLHFFVLIYQHQGIYSSVVSKDI